MFRGGCRGRGSTAPSQGAPCPRPTLMVSRTEKQASERGRGGARRLAVGYLFAFFHFCEQLPNRGRAPYNNLRESARPYPARARQGTRIASCVWILIVNCTFGSSLTSADTAATTPSPESAPRMRPLGNLMCSDAICLAVACRDAAAEQRVSTGCELSCSM